MKRQLQKTVWRSSFFLMLSITIAFICWQPQKAKAAPQVSNDGFEYELYTDSDEKQWAVIKGYNGTEANLTIPAQIDDHDVISITERAFENNDILQSVTIEEGITVIGNGAFTFCDNLQTISIPASVPEIDAFMFENNDKLSEIRIAEGHSAYVSVDGVVYNKDKTSLYLYPCGREGDYSVLENVTSISSYAFMGCSKIRNITLPATVTSLGTNAFAYSGVASVNLPQGLKTIGTGAFMKAKNLESLNIPSTVTTIGRYPFWGCKSLTGFEVASGNSKYASGDGVIFNKAKTILYWYPGGKSGAYTVPSTVVQIKESAFVECEYLTEITFSAKLSTLEDGAFMGCSGLKELELPSGITSIGEGVFSDCSALERISLPSAMTTIGKSALSGCVSLKEITLPDSLNSINSSALIGCSELENIFIADTNAAYSSIGGVLFNKEKTTLICCPEGKSGTYAIPEGVTVINNSAFSGCKKIDTIVLPCSIETLTTTVCNALDKCNNLSAIDVAVNHPTYQSIDGALYGRDDATLYFCSRGKTGTFVVPDGITVIDTQAFQNCVHLSEIILPDTVTTLKGYAFHKCTGLKHIIIPNGVTELYANIFNACELESITIPENVTKISVYAFGYEEDSSGWGWDKLEKQPVVRCFKDSFAHSFAETQKLEIELLTRLTPEMVSLPASVTYKTESIEPEMTVKDGDRTLQKGVDYDVAYLDNDRTGIATVTITGKGTIIGTITKTFTITAKTLTEADVNLAADSAEYTGAEIKPQVTVKDGEKALTEGTDYTLSYENNIEVGTAAKVIVNGKGNYDGTVTKTFAITEKKPPVPITVDLSTCIISLAPESAEYTSAEIKPQVIVKDGDKTLIEGTDYELSYKNNINVGNAAQVTVTGKGNYTGTVGKKFTITAKALTQAVVTLSSSSCIYNGKACEPEVTVKLDGKELKAGEDYGVSYSNHTNIGTASVIITGKNNYTGNATKTFNITVKKGSAYTVGAYKYKITSSSEVSFAGLKNKKTAKVNVPKTVKIGGKTFKVTSIDAKALKKTSVTSVTVGNNVKTIGNSAFEGCSKLTKVTIGTGVTKIGTSTFKSCKKLGSITVKSAKLKTVGKNAFKGIKSNAKIKVPSKKLKDYKKLLKGKGQGKKVKITK